MNTIIRTCTSSSEMAIYYKSKVNYSGMFGQIISRQYATNAYVGKYG